MGSSLEPVLLPTSLTEVEWSYGSYCRLQIMLKAANKFLFREEEKEKKSDNADKHTSTGRVNHKGEETYTLN